MRRATLTLLALISLQTAAFAVEQATGAEQTIHLVTSYNNEENTNLPPTSPYNEVLIDWAAWADNPQEPITECYIWGPYNATLLHHCDDEIAWTGSSIFNTSDPQVKQKSGERCRAEDDCFGFVPDSDGLSCKVTVCDSDPLNLIPDCGLAPEGPDLYTQVRKDHGKFTLVCLRESTEGLQAVDEDYQFDPPTLDSVDCRPDDLYPQYKCDITTTNARQVTISDCGTLGTVTFTLSGTGPETSSVECPLNQKLKQFTVTASNGFSGPTGTVSKSYTLRLGDLDNPAESSLTFTCDGTHCDDGDSAGSVNLKFGVSRTWEFHEQGFILFQPSQGGSRGGHIYRGATLSGGVPWVKSVTVWENFDRSVGLLSGIPVHFRAAVGLPSDANGLVQASRAYHLHKYQLNVCDFDGRCFSRTIDTPYPAPEFHVEPTGGDTCYDFDYDLQDCLNFKVKVTALVSGRFLKQWVADCAGTDQTWLGLTIASPHYRGRFFATGPDQVAQPTADNYGLQVGSFKHWHPGGDSYTCSFSAETWEGQWIPAAQLQVRPGENLCHYQDAGGDIESAHFHDLTQGGSVGRFCDGRSSVRHTRVTAVPPELGVHRSY